MRPAHRILGLTRPAVIMPAGRAWRLGVLLIDRDGRLYATGEVTRAIDPKRGVADHSLIADARREDATCGGSRLLRGGRGGQLRVLPHPRSTRRACGPAPGRCR